MRVLFLISAVMAATLGACAHEAENTGAQNSQNTITLPTMQYAMQTRPDSVANRGISRFQRQPIVPGGMDGDMDPCAKNFDGVMDHLEILMEKKIAENNEIAAKQAAVPGYRF